MSTAIMLSGAFNFDLGDYMMKNQTTSLNTMALHNSNNSNSNTTGLIGSTPSSINSNFSNNNNNNNSNSVAQQSLASALVAAQRQQQQQQHQINQQHQQQQKFLLHNTLSRTVSHPLPENQMASLVSSLNVILGGGVGVGAGHRKLERTQSEPLPQVNASRYKTELCRPFEEAGECKYGDKCQFAHGHHELRNLQRHPKYKTELCRTFHSVGFCPYGPRCHFVHNAEEARHHNRAVAAYHARLAQLNAQRQAANGTGANNTSAPNQHHHHMPLSPAMSMSTGSDRASPTGSLSLSPTSSMTSFFPEQNSPTFQQGFVFPQQSTPPSSPSSGVSPIATPPPPGEVDSRLPVFNRLSSAIDAFTKISIV